MNNFDAYVVTRNNKAPKGFVFAVKSTDNITYFESTSDYLHTFSVPEKEGDNWLEKILLARVRLSSPVSASITHSSDSLILYIRSVTFSSVALTQVALVLRYLELALESVGHNLSWTSVGQ